MKRPSLRRLKIFSKVLWKKLSIIEKTIIGLLILVFILDLSGAFSSFFNSSDSLLPEKGGVIVEGVIGQPRFINPLFARSDTDKTLSSLIFPGLITYNKQKEPISSLAEKWEISENKTDYKFFLKKDVLWHDKQVFNADDVLYTVAVLQNPDYKEALKSTWEGIRIEKVDDFTVIFHLPKAFPSFLNNLTIGIVPRHVWDSTTVTDMPKSSFNLNAIGTGPYSIDGVNRDKSGKIISLKMVANSLLGDNGPNIQNFEMKFYDNKEDLVKGFQVREFSSFGIYSGDSQDISQKDRGFNNYNVNLPQYVSLFLNKKKNPALNDIAVRQAMSYGLDKNKVNEAGTYGAGVVIDSPMLPGYLGYSSDVKKYAYDQKAASSTLTQAGWGDQNNDGVKEKDDKILSFEIVTVDSPELARVAENISAQWAKIGIRTSIKKIDATTLDKDYLQTRNFDILLFGESMGTDPDPYPYWHSSQVTYPGLNISGFTNGEADKVLEEARQSSDTNVKLKDYKKFQDIIADEIPAIFLYQPVYVYKIYDKVKGVDLSSITNTWDRFFDVKNWFVKYRRK